MNDGNNRYVPNVRASGVVIPAGFCIKSKEDARVFLEKLVCKGSLFVIKDVTNPGWHFVIDRQDKGNTALVAYEKDDKSVFAPDLMYDGEEAISLIYRGRKSLNQKWFVGK